MQREELIFYLADLLKVNEFKDLCPNGLQVEGRDDINKIVTAVSASVEMFEQAIKENADTIIVHHGIIWEFERPLYKGGYRERIRLLLDHNINLLAYHLPLDAHPELGNNAQLAYKLDLHDIEPFADYKGQYIGIKGKLADLPKEKLYKKVEAIVRRKPLIFAYGPHKIKTIGINSGAAQKDIRQAVDQNLDAFITGEVSEHILHFAKEEGIHFISAGHYATEKFGIMALGEHLQNKFDIEIKFLDIPNPV